MILLGAVRAETLKTWKRPAVWVCVAILLLLLIVLGYGITYFVYTYTKATPTRGGPRLDYAVLKQALYPTHFHQSVLNGGAQLGGVLMMIIGVLLQGSEYGWGTVKTVFTQRPTRWTVVVARLVVIAVVALLVAVLLLGLGALTSWTVAAIDGKTASFPFPAASTVARAALVLWLTFFFWAVFGFGLATLFRQSTLAIGLGLAYALVIEALAFGLADQFAGDPSRRIHQWFPLANVSYLIESFGSAVPAAATGQPATTPFADATHAAVVLALYCLGFVVLSVALTQRRDVIS